MKKTGDSSDRLVDMAAFLSENLLCCRHLQKMNSWIFCILFTAVLFCSNDRIETKKDEETGISEKIRIETERLVNFSDAFRATLEKKDLHKILDLFEDTIDISNCYFEKPNVSRFFVGYYSFDKKKHSEEFLKGKGVLYSCLFDISTLIQKKLAPPNIFSISELFQKNDTKFHYTVHLKGQQYTPELKGEGYLYSKDTYLLTASAMEEQPDAAIQKTLPLTYLFRIDKNSQGNLLIRSFDIEIPKHLYYRINYDTVGTSVPVIEAIKNNDPGKLLKYFSNSVFYRSGGDGGGTIWFRKTDKKQKDEFIGKKGKFYDVLFNTENGRREAGGLFDNQKSLRDSLLNGVISKPLGPVCGITPNDDRLLIFAETPYAGAIYFHCPRKDCTKCKIEGFSGDD